MNFIPLRQSGLALAKVHIANVKGDGMSMFRFLVDTGATNTTIPKSALIEDIGYSKTWIQNNKIMLTESQKPKLANGEKADLYAIPITRINIRGHEFQPEFNILTSDTVNIGLLLGLDILSYFNFSFNFDEIDAQSPYGRMLYQFRDSRKAKFTRVGAPFAHRLSGDEVEL